MYNYMMAHKKEVLVSNNDAGLHKAKTEDYALLMESASIEYFLLYFIYIYIILLYIFCIYYFYYFILYLTYILHLSLITIYVY